VLQAKLLRAIEERVFEPVGSNQVRRMEARLIAASNRPLLKEVDAGRFRSDLYYRLNVVGFYLPRLEERRNLIPHLVTRFIKEFAQRNRRDVQGITPEALSALEEYSWPGNIRELRNIVERAVALCPGSELCSEDFPETICPPKPEGWSDLEKPLADGAKNLRDARGEAEAVLIAETLKKHRNNRLRAAAELGISRMTLYTKLRKYGLMEAV